MGVVWQLLEENGIRQMGVKGPRQRVAKGPVVEAAPAARRLEEAGGPGGVRGTGEPAPAAGDPGRERNGEAKEDWGGQEEQGSQR